MEYSDIKQLRLDFEKGKIKQSEMTKEQIFALYVEYTNELERLEQENKDLDNILENKKKELLKIINELKKMQ